MSVLSGYGKYKRYVLTSTGYKLCSQWTSSNTVHFDDGKTAQTKLGAISGITDSLTSTSSNVALSAKAGKSLQDQVTELNTGMEHIGTYYQTDSLSTTKIPAQTWTALSELTIAEPGYYLVIAHFQFTNASAFGAIRLSPTLAEIRSGFNVKDAIIHYTPCMIVNYVHTAKSNEKITLNVWSSVALDSTQNALPTIIQAIRIG